MDIILNELSLQQLAATAAQARAVLDQWLQLVDALSRQLAVQPVFRAAISLLHLPVAQDGYLFVQWLDALSPDEQARALAATAQTPFVRESYPEYRFRGTAPPIPAECYDVECHGFAYAVEHSCLTWSLDPQAHWPAPQYPLARLTVEAENVHEEVLPAWHLPATGLVPAHQPFLAARLSDTEQRIIQSNRTGAALLRFWSVHFTHLDLTAEATRTLPLVPTGALPAVIRLLIELQRFFSHWNGIPANYETALAFKATQESDSRLREYAQNLLIRCLDGETRLMNWHLRYTPDAGRLYFIPNEAQRRCFVGYVGLKIGD